METDCYIFAWGDPLVSSPAALSSVVRQFAEFCRKHAKNPVWLCISRGLSDVLAEELRWCAISCMTEDEVDPSYIVGLTSPAAKGREGQRIVKDLKKNLAKAEKSGVEISEIKAGGWSENDRSQVLEGIKRWKAGKRGVQLASSSFRPWVDFEHRRYWVARVGKQARATLLCPSRPSLSTHLFLDRWNPPIDTCKIRFMADKKLCRLPLCTERNLRGFDILHARRRKSGMV